MKERFEPFKELLKALREIKYAIEGKDNGAGLGNGNDIVLPKYALCNFFSISSPSSSPSSGSELSESNPSEGDEGGAPAILPNSSVFKVFEIDYSGKFLITKEEINNLPEEEGINLIQSLQNYTANPAYNDNTKRGQLNSVEYLYTKEQIDTINKNSIIQLDYGIITKFDDNVVMDILDMSNYIGALPDDIQRGQYYCIITKALYDYIMTSEPMGA